MAIDVTGKSGKVYTFEGPYSTPEKFQDRSGVYLITCGEDNNAIDVGESKEVRTRVENHDRSDCWFRNCEAPRYSVHYVEYGKKPSRMEIEQDIRAEYHFPCGSQ